jgi:hypothetical protein
MARLSNVIEGHGPAVRAEIEQRLAEGGFISDVGRMLTYRPELYGRPASEAFQDAMRGDSEWSVGERELMAAFVSAQNQCPF